MDVSVQDLNGFNEDQDVNFVYLIYFYIKLFLSQVELNKRALKDLGGVLKLEEKLKTDFKLGLSGNKADLKLRRDLFGKNEVMV
jgi:hypothetical protein